jgi:hypothetical protein
MVARPGALVDCSHQAIIGGETVLPSVREGDNAPAPYHRRRYV